MENDIVKLKAVESRIVEVRGEKVILDRDVAALYGVETREINQAVKNNPEKFPEGYIFKLTKAEKSEVIKIFDNLAEGGDNADNQKLKFSPTIPNAFTERGLYMLATILKSKCATQTTIAIVDTFTKIRELSRTVATLSATDTNTLRKT